MKRFCLIFTVLMCIPLLACAKNSATAPAASVIILPNATAEAEPTPPPEAETNADFVAPSTAPAQVSIKVDKSDKILTLYGDGKTLGTFPVRVGSASGKKTASGDNKTPEGEYYITTRVKKSDGSYFMGISYPNTNDAKAALDQGKITTSVYNSIKTAIDGGKAPPGNTALGGSMGFSQTYDQGETTKGNIALSEANMKVLWQYTKLGTKVQIVP